ncbi:MAG: hypothetical protein HQ556_13545 [Candidatus Marinimicrobia bacterium]|nr:hypothetical protein [Candidatus Neomarinimicrobiota bacterium]
MSQKSKKNAEIVPASGTEASQVIDIKEPSSSRLGNEYTMNSSLEVLGSVKAQRRMQHLSEATLIIDLARIQDAFNGTGDMVLNTPSKTFKDFVEELGYSYKTILNKIILLRKSSPQIYQLFDRLGLPATLHQRVTEFPKELKEKALALLADPSIQSAGEAKEVIRDLYEAYVSVKDRADEAALKEKAELIDERDLATKHSNMFESTLIKVKEKLNKQEQKHTKLLATLNPSDLGLAYTKTLDRLEATLRAISAAEDIEEDATILTQTIRLKNLITQVPEID